jgi:hypothetical protein
VRKASSRKPPAPPNALTLSPSLVRHRASPSQTPAQGAVSRELSGRATPSWAALLFRAWKRWTAAWRSRNPSVASMGTPRVTLPTQDIRMAHVIRMRPRRRRSFGVLRAIVCAGFGVLIGAALVFYWDHQFAAKNAQSTTTIGTAKIEVIDGDTVRANGNVYRLVGYDAPETGLDAKCETERGLPPAQHPGCARSWLQVGFGLSVSHVPAPLAPKAHRNAITVGCVPCLRRQSAM